MDDPGCGERAVHGRVLNVSDPFTGPRWQGAELTRRLHDLGAFAEALAGDVIVPNEPLPPPSEPGTMAMAHMEWSPIALDDDARRFLSVAHADGWIEPYDWVSWIRTPKATVYRTDADTILRAPAEDLGRLLTYAVRQERFVTNALLTFFDNGMMQRIAQRAHDLAIARREEPDDQI